MTTEFKRKKARRILEFIVLLQIMIIIIFANNYKLTLLLNGFNTKTDQIIYTGMNDNNREYRVIEHYKSGKVTEIAIFSKNALGIWRKTEHTYESNGILEIGWITTAGMQTYEKDIRTQFEVHHLYCGDNAIQMIPSLVEYLPDNTTVDIQQIGTSYSIHLIAYGNAEILNSVSMSNILSKIGCISK